MHQPLLAYSHSSLHHIGGGGDECTWRAESLELELKAFSAPFLSRSAASALLRLIKPALKAELSDPPPGYVSSRVFASSTISIAEELIDLSRQLGLHDYAELSQSVRGRILAILCDLACETSAVKAASCPPPPAST